MKVNRHQGLVLGKPDIRGFKVEHETVKHDARVCKGMMMRVRCVYRIKIRSREVLQTPKFQAPSWLHAGSMPPSCPWTRENRDPWVWKQKTWRSNTMLEPSRVWWYVKDVYIVSSFETERPFRPQSCNPHHGCKPGWYRHHVPGQGKTDIRGLENRKHGGQTRC